MSNPLCAFGAIGLGALIGIAVVLLRASLRRGVAGRVPWQSIRDAERRARR